MSCMPNNIHVNIMYFGEPIDVETQYIKFTNLLFYTDSMSDRCDVCLCLSVCVAKSYSDSISDICLSDVSVLPYVCTQVIQ